MAISVTKSGPYFTSGAISFSAMRNTFRLNNPTGTISASELLRNTDITNTEIFKLTNSTLSLTI